MAKVSYRRNAVSSAAPGRSASPAPAMTSRCGTRRPDARRRRRSPISRACCPTSPPTTCCTARPPAAVRARMRRCADAGGGARRARSTSRRTRPRTSRSSAGVRRARRGGARRDAVLASSTSAILPSAFTETLAGRARCLVVHPINPPYLIPAVEIVPAPWTDPAVVERTAAILRAAGHAPIVMKREIDGFVMNRMQGALLEEAFRLVADGYASSKTSTSAFARGWRCAGRSWGRSRRSTSTRRAACATTPSATSRSMPASSPDAVARRIGRAGDGHDRGGAAQAPAGRQARRAPGLARPPADGARGAQARARTKDIGR